MEFLADRPFLFLLFDRKCKAVLFAGQLVAPGTGTYCTATASCVTPRQFNAKNGWAFPIRASQTNLHNRYLRHFPNVPTERVTYSLDKEGPQSDSGGPMVLVLKAIKRG